MKITLPWPDRRLSPNEGERLNIDDLALVRRMTFARQRAREAARNHGFLCAREIYVPGENTPFTGNLTVTYFIHPPSRRRHDHDNVLSALKHYVDGVCDALGIDDNQFKTTTIAWGDVVKGGKVVMNVEEL